jgi:hypothetical protein
VFTSLLVLVLSGGICHGAGGALDGAAIERLTGARGTLDPKEGVFKVAVPRTDLHVTAAGTTLTPAMGLTSWVGFQRIGGADIVMGDLVLLEDQVNPVMSAALENGLEVTALHNHFLWESPRIMFMHIGGTGDERALAAAVGAVFARMRETAAGRGAVPPVAVDPAATSLDPRPIEEILGVAGELVGGVYKVTIGRATRMHGAPVGSAMGVNTWAAFAGSDERAVADGDFAVGEGELQSVLKALRRAGISIAAIHSHMTGEEPRVLFLHYWAAGSTRDIARGLKAALDTQARGR